MSEHHEALPADERILQELISINSSLNFFKVFLILYSVISILAGITR